MLTPLRLYSQYSLLESCITAEKAKTFLKKHNINCAPICDTNNMFGSFNWSVEMKNANIKPIIGCELKVSKGYISAFCKNETGYLELSNLISESYIEKNGILDIASIQKLKNCILLCDSSLSEQEIVSIKNLDLGIAISKQIFDKEKEQFLFKISNAYDIPIVAAPKFCFTEEKEFLSVDSLRCIKNNEYLSEQKIKLFEDQFLENLPYLEKQFEDIPFAIYNCLNITKKCNFYLQKHDPIMPSLGIENVEQEIENLVHKGLSENLNQFVLPKIAAEKHEETVKIYEERADFELSMIKQMKFCDYFLIVSDIVRWAKSQNIPVGPGRGSGASCLVAWALKITNVDPIYFKLMFERFLNPDRVSLPDFDIDFCQQRRNEVVEYIQKRFGKENVAHIITFGSLQYRAAIRDIGRVMQIPYPVVDGICKKLPPPFQGIAPTIKDLRAQGMLKEVLNPETEQLFEVAENIEGLPRHLSVHAAGIVIGNRKLSDIVPLYKEPDVEMPIIQFSMKPAEQIGLVKFDILGLAILSVIKKTSDFINQKTSFDINLIPYDDQKTFEILQKGYVKGIFQVDSPGFKNLLLDMLPNCLEDLVAAGALYRPGPMQDIPQFIKCKKEKSFDFFYPEMENILKETYSVIVYQEQILQIAKEMAGYSLKEADLLRRAMGKKIKSEMALHEEKFVQGILSTIGGLESKAKTLFENLARFASYGFPKAHAAPYGVMTYQSAYLKAHYPAEFYCATLIYENTQEKCQEIMQEAKSLGIEILPPDINKSNFTFNLENQAVRYGLSNIKGIGDSAKIIIEERIKNGIYTSLSNLINRTKINKKAQESLAFSGSLDSISDIARNKQISKMLETKENTTTISLFDFYEEEPDLNEIEIVKHEFDVMKFVFYDKIFQHKLNYFNIHDNLNDLKNGSNLLYVIGIGPVLKKNKDDRIIITYTFIDKNGFQELFTSEEYKLEWQEIIIEIETYFLNNGNIKHSIKNIQSFDQYLSGIKKLFVKDENINLPEGETSIYYENQGKTKFLGNFKLNKAYIYKLK